MARFLNRAVTFLEGLYRFEGSRIGTDQVDLARPVTLVHDVSRGVTITSDFTNADGYLLITATHAHVGASIVTSQVDPYLVTDIMRKPRASTRIWILSFFADTGLTAAQFSDAHIGYLTPVLPVGSAVSSRFQLLASYDSTVIPLVVGSNRMLTATGENPLQNPMPINVLPVPASGGTGGTICFASNSNAGAASNIRLAAMCWAGPRGSEPPPG